MVIGSRRSPPADQLSGTPTRRCARLINLELLTLRQPLKLHVVNDDFSLSRRRSLSPGVDRSGRHHSLGRLTHGGTSKTHTQSQSLQRYQLAAIRETLEDHSFSDSSLA